MIKKIFLDDEIIYSLELDACVCINIDERSYILITFHYLDPGLGAWVEGLGQLIFFILISLEL